MKNQIQDYSSRIKMTKKEEQLTKILINTKKKRIKKKQYKKICQSWGYKYTDYKHYSLAYYKKWIEA